MPQSPLGAYVATGNGKLVPLQTDSQGVLRVSGGGISVVYNLTAATVVKATPGRCVTVSVIVAGSAAGTANDVTNTAGAVVANQFGTIPNTVGVYKFEWPCLSGIVIVPGTGQTVSVAFN